MTTADIFVKILEDQGIEYCFALPGEENLDFLEALRKSKIRLIVTRHEQAAAFMAATYGRLTGKPGLCLATLGPGALNLVTGVAYATLGGMPLIAVTGQKAVRDNWQGQFQMVDVVNVMRPITKWTTTITSPEMVSRAAYQAVTLAREERPGAVHVEIPEDIAGEAHESHFLKHLPPPNRRPVADEKAIKIAANLIKQAKRPIIIVSSGGNRKLVTKQLKNLVDLTGLYVIGTQLGKGVLPDDDPHSLGAVGMHRRDYVNCAIDYSDLIITVGYHVNEHPPSVWNPNKDKAILHLDFKPAEPDEFYLPAFQVVGDISYTLWALQAYLQNASWEIDYYQQLRHRLTEIYQKDSADPAYPLTPQRIVHDVRQVMGREDIVTLDNGIYKLWFARQYQTFAPNTLLLDNALATMGAGLPSALAAKLLYPQKKVLAVCGDGGFMMNSQEIITCVKENIPVVVLILNDNAYGFIEWKQKNAGLPDFGLRLQNPDFVKYAEAYGALGLKVTSANDLIPQLQQAFASDRPTIVECPIDYSQNFKVFDEELKNLQCELPPLN
ncbi:MAG: acetolactate synthase large subunit [Candidatus Magasanikbacteria bacterium]|nr:acetolactate synthase large subunit [Candidatus Magasanikbacteria bacterium]